MFRPFQGPATLGLTALLAVIAVGCSSSSAAKSATPDVSSDDRSVITREQIARGGWRTAWEVVQQTGKLHLVEQADETSVRVLHRGVTSMTDNTPLLFIDGVRVGNLAVLKQIPASDLLRVRVLSGLEADIGIVGGTAAGVIEITTISQ